MTAKELREKYLKFFESKGHTIIPSAPLVPSEKVELSGTQKLLFTTAGMHPLITYLLGEEHPEGKRLTNVQKCLRTDDIDEVGDSWHNTFFEMLGNWSLGGLDSEGSAGAKDSYWKKEAIGWSYEFITQELKLPKEKLWVSVFAGDSDAPKDSESIEIWKSLGVPEERIVSLPKKDNWWGPVGETGPCGPDTEMFIDVSGKAHGKDCLPGDGCGRFSEIWNNVFMEYERKVKTQNSKGKTEYTYVPLKQRNVDTGMGVERTTAVLQGKDNVYETELFASAINIIKKKSKNFDATAARVVADHLRASIFLIADGVIPSNTDRGYILRRLIRRSVRYNKVLAGEIDLIHQVTREFVQNYAPIYPELKEKEETIFLELSKEEEKFQRVIEEGLKRSQKLFQTKIPIEKDKFNKMMQSGDKKEIFREYFQTKKKQILEKFGAAISSKELDKATISGKEAFDLYQSYGFPTELIVELAQVGGLIVDVESLEKEVGMHKQISRAGASQKFAGGLADHSDLAVRGHTATHLLHQALRDVLGENVHQIGSNITPERIRFDFSHGEKLTEEQIKKVEDIVNSKIKEDLPVKKELMSQEEADKKGAIGLFKDKYGDKVSIYEIGDPSASSGRAYSIEYCGGPHVDHTSQVGQFKILKEETLGAGQRRIRAVLE